MAMFGSYGLIIGPKEMVAQFIHFQPEEIGQLLESGIVTRTAATPISERHVDVSKRGIRFL